MDFTTIVRVVNIFEGDGFKREMVIWITAQPSPSVRSKGKVRVSRDFMPTSPMNVMFYDSTIRRRMFVGLAGNRKRQAM
jgi:hypothetical protein